MPANHRSPKHRSGSGRTTPKGTRPPGSTPRATDHAEATGLDHHLDASPPKHLHGRSAPPNAIRQRSGRRGGR